MKKIDVVLENHYARFLGKPHRRSELQLEANVRLTIEEFENKPCQGAATLVTSGLANQLTGGTCHQHELLVSCYPQFVTGDLVKLIGAIGTQVLQSHHPLSRGDILGPAGSLLPGLAMEALYVCPPTYFDNDFSRILISDDLDIHILWLIPLHRTEVAWVKKRGFSDFESLLEEKDPDLLDWARSPIV
jgi:hypothetical protein